MNIRSSFDGNDDFDTAKEIINFKYDMRLQRIHGRVAQLG